VTGTAELTDAPPAEPGAPAADPGGTRRSRRRQRLRTVARHAGTVLGALLLWFALVGPNRPDQLTPMAFVRLPIEGLVLAALLLVLPGRWSRITAAAAGAILALLTVVKILDIGFFAALDRPFNPDSDWSYFGPALGVLRDSVGGTSALVIAFALGLLMIVVLAGMPLAAVRISGIVRRHRSSAARTLGALAAVWAIVAALGLQVGAGEPVASTSAAGLAYGEVRLVRTAIHDQQVFSSALSGHDPYRDIPTGRLLSGLRGKDVIVAFVESYGQVAVQDSSIAPGVDAVLRAATAQLRSHGFAARSAFLTSPTFGGISWLAHSTLQSGLWVDSQDRYDALVGSQRFTLSDAFGQAGWRTVGDVPSNRGDWRDGHAFYHYDQLYNRTDVGYAGPAFSYASMPDEYILSAFNRLELAQAPRRPVMAEIDLVSSHIPWAPLPKLVPWNAVGDGTVYGPMPAEGPSVDSVWSSSAGVRAAYGRSIQYSVQSLVSFVEHANDPNLVLVMLGDHQPSTVVTGWNATHNVPVSIVAADPKVLDRISSWRWQDGLLPGPDAPVWRMDAFRNRFLSAYSDGGPR
jgi:hypothetical protein